jgi:hypothetical protein
MPDETTIQKITAALRSSYGDLDNPDFHKVASMLDQDPYRSLIENLRASGVMVTETTDPNDDVSTQLVVSRSGEQVALELSAVGPFGVVRHLREDGCSQWVSKPSETASSLAADVAAIAERAGLRLLDRDTAATKIRMNLTGEDTHATLYQALFTNTDRIP